jgi:hypothetical protein
VSSFLSPSSSSNDGDSERSPKMWKKGKKQVVVPMPVPVGADESKADLSEPQGTATHTRTLSISPAKQLLSPSKWCVGDAASDEAILTAHLAELTERNKELAAKKAKNDMYIVALHSYNEIKDTTQSVFGNIAQRQCCRTRDVYAQYDLDVNA